MYSILRTLSYGQKLQIAEGSIRIPLDDPRNDTWITKSEEENTKKGQIKPIKKIAGKGEAKMSNGTPCPDPNETPCHPMPRPGYFTWNPKNLPQLHCALSFSTCCCEDGTAGLLEALYQFALAKKAANPNILSVEKVFSPNGSCSALSVQLSLFNNAPGTLVDWQAIVQYYLTLLGY